MPRDRPYRLVDRVDYLVERCRGRKILHLGCTNWPYAEQSRAAGMLLHDTLAGVAGDLWGLDSDERGIEELRGLGYHQLVVGDLEHLVSLPDGAVPVPDVIVAGEVIEHLASPGEFLRGVQQLMGPDTTLVVTTVNAYCAFRFAQYALRGRGGVAEPVHPDHVAYYSRATLSLLVERAGLVLSSFSFYDLGREHRPFSRRAVRVVNDVAVRVSPQLADGVIAECTLPGGPR